MGILFFWPMVGSLLKSTGQLRLVGLGAGACIVAILWRSLSVDMLDQNPWNAVIFLALGTAAASWTSDCKSTIPSASKVDKLILSTPKSQPLLRQQSARYGTGRFVGHHGRQTGF
jgi:hypothetical protein